MFRIWIYGSCKVQLDGCPVSGIAAADWRREHGLPVEPSGILKLDGIYVFDEPLCRRLTSAWPERATEEGDWSICASVCDVEMEMRIRRNRKGVCGQVSVKDWVPAVSSESALGLMTCDHDHVIGYVSDLQKAKRLALEELDKAEREFEEAQRARKEFEERAREFLARELADGRQAAERLETLSRCLYHMPPDAIVGALRAWAAVDRGESMEDLRRRVDDAMIYPLR